MATTADKKKTDARAQGFLGREFLTWLWFRCETDGGTFELPSKEPKKEGKRRKSEEEAEAQSREVGVVFNDYIALIADGEEREQSIVKKGSAHRSSEARTALLVGKVVDTARLEVARGERTWSLTVGGETLDLRGVKYPDPEGDDADERALERLDAMQELGTILDGLYELFLGVRTSKDWDGQEVPAMQRWIQKRARTEVR